MKFDPRFKLAFLFAFWVLAVTVRGFIAVHPWMMMWWVWVTMHGIAAGCFGYYLHHFTYEDLPKLRQAQARRRR